MNHKNIDNLLNKVSEENEQLKMTMQFRSPSGNSIDDLKEQTKQALESVNNLLAIIEEQKKQKNESPKNTMKLDSPLV